MSVTDFRASCLSLMVIGLINVAFAIKCFIMSIVHVEVGGIVGGVILFFYGLSVILVSRIGRQINPIIIKIFIGLATIFLCLTFASFVMSFVNSVNLGFTEATIGLQITGIITYALENFLLFKHYQLLTNADS